jgi:hypothetical protein
MIHTLVHPRSSAALLAAARRDATDAPPGQEGLVANRRTAISATSSNTCMGSHRRVIRTLASAVATGQNWLLWLVAVTRLIGGLVFPKNPMLGRRHLQEMTISTRGPPAVVDDRPLHFER